jgi:cytochrome c oxidase subunit 4
MSELEAKGVATEAAAPGASEGAEHAHETSARLYVGVFVALLCCTLLTVALSHVHLGRLNLAMAIAIASAKASLVVLFFMHLRQGSRFHAMILVVSLLFVGVFFAYTMNDTERRGEIDADQGARVSPSTGLPAPGGAE